MEIIIAGKIFSIKSLEPSIDKSFVELHAAYFSNQALRWDDFKNQAISFFDKYYGDMQLTEGYFNNFTIIWQYYRTQGLWDLAKGMWRLALEPVKEWESINKGKRIHKGTPYYFWGMTAIQSGDIDQGYALMHQALEEDVITFGGQFPDTPSFAFATLNYEKVDQAFLQWVKLEAQYLDKAIKNYSDGRGRKLTLDDFKNKFLKSPPNIDVVYLLAYTIARLIRFEELPVDLLSSPFAGELLQNLLFDLAQIVDITIAKKDQSDWKTVDHINYLSRKSGIPISKKNLRDANSKFNSNFEMTILQILDNTYLFKDRTSPTPLQSDLLLFYGLRNRGAHSVSSTPIVWKRFEYILDATFNSLFLASEILY